MICRSRKQYNLLFNCCCCGVQLSATVPLPSPTLRAHSVHTYDLVRKFVLFCGILVGLIDLDFEPLVGPGEISSKSISNSSFRLFITRKKKTQLVDFLPNLNNQIIVSLFFISELFSQQRHDASVPMAPKSRAGSKMDFPFQFSEGKSQATRRDRPFPDATRLAARLGCCSNLALLPSYITRTFTASQSGRSLTLDSISQQWGKKLGRSNKTSFQQTKRHIRSRFVWFARILSGNDKTQLDIILQPRHGHAPHPLQHSSDTESSFLRIR